MKEKNIKFEEGLDKLEKIVGRLEGSNISLDESLKLFEEGIKLSKFCRAKLENAEKRIEILKKKSNGDLMAEEFEPNEKEEKKKTKKKIKKVKKEEDKGLDFFNEEE
jgi:exodeoxyribonuclease VII small subunit